MQFMRSTVTSLAAIINFYIAKEDYALYALPGLALTDCRRATAATARPKTSTARIIKKIFPTDAIVATKFVLWPEKMQEPLPK